MTPQIEPIEGQIAEVLDSREVALNIGKEQGVAVGMLFDILAKKGHNIRDPETNEVLGSIDFPKTRVRVTRVESKFSVAETYRTKLVNVRGGSGVYSLFRPPTWETRYETLKARESFEHAAEALGQWNSYVSRGDPVIQIVDNEQRQSQTLRQIVAQNISN